MTCLGRRFSSISGTNFFPADDSPEHFDFEIVHFNESLSVEIGPGVSATAALPERVSKGGRPLWPPEAFLLLDNFTMNLL